MKRLLVPVLTVLLLAALSGCAVVAPYDHPSGVYSASPIYNQPYAVAPAPVYSYGPPVYVGPPVRFNFGLSYHSYHGGRGRPHGFAHGHGHRHHGHGFRGGRGAWRR